MSINLPPALLEGDDEKAVKALRRYYGHPYLESAPFTGAHFDSWAQQNLDANPNRFTAEDLIAVSFLSISVKPLVARVLLDTDADRFAEMLEAIGPDRDLADVPGQIDNSWPAWRLDNALQELGHVGLTTASKLIARKRPRLYPIYDSVVTAVLGTAKRHLVPVRDALRANDCQLHHRLLRIREAAGLPDTISALRVFDVIVWMHGKDKSVPANTASHR